MGWHVFYNTLKDGRVEFNKDVAIGSPTWKPTGKTDDEAIQSVQNYLVEIYSSNGVSSRFIPDGIEMFDMSKQKIIESYKDFSAKRCFLLTDSKGDIYESEEPGLYGGHRKLKTYGRLDCPSAARYIAKGQYVKYRVFFKDEETAIAAGYRPCGICMKEAYREWKRKNVK